MHKSCKQTNHITYREPGTHLTLRERRLIQREWDAAVKSFYSNSKRISIRKAATNLGLNYKTLRDELLRGGGLRYEQIGEGSKPVLIYTTYYALDAEQRYQNMLSNKGPRQKVTNHFAEEVRKVMRADGSVSPATALKRLQEKGVKTPCIRTFYHYINTGELGIDNSYLPRGKYARKPKPRPPRIAKNCKDKDWLITNMDPELLSRENFGTWEMDTIVSGRNGKGGVLVLTERKTRHCVHEKLPGISQYCVARAVKRLVQNGELRFVKAVLTDNGTEFLDHDALQKLLSCDVFYTHAYASYEKGSVENANGLFRRWYPKGTDFSRCTNAQIKAVSHEINSIVRHTSLGGKTADEAFQEEIKKLIP